MSLRMMLPTRSNSRSIRVAALSCPCDSNTDWLRKRRFSAVKNNQRERKRVDWVTRLTERVDDAMHRLASCIQE